MREIELSAGRETASKRRSGQIKRLNKEFEEEGYGDDFGTFLDELDEAVDVGLEEHQRLLDAAGER
jgi:hypothetical protein